ncbi:MAG: hypothetical protein RIR33_3599 [Pseudomonadota bacterium]|jgi:hypothetical protein
MRVIFGIFPLLAIPIIIYNVIAFTSGGATDANGVSVIAMQLANPETGTPVFGAWRITGGDILMILSMIFFFVEIIKSTSTGSSTIANHAVSMIVFIVCLVEFLLLPAFQTSVFFILTFMCLLDVLAGVVVTIVSARRDFSVGDSHN